MAPALSRPLRVGINSGGGVWEGRDNGIMRCEGVGAMRRWGVCHASGLRARGGNVPSRCLVLGVRGRSPPTPGLPPLPLEGWRGWGGGAAGSWQPLPSHEPFLVAVWIGWKKCESIPETEGV